ncbi:MAG: OstA-like protein [Bacteroidales bacterium]
MITRIFIFFFSLMLLTISLSGQNGEDKKEKTRIQLVQADRMTYSKERLGPGIQRLVGNVIFEHDSMYLYCDSAYLYEKDNSMNAWGDIRIRASDSLNIYGEELKYNGNSGMAEMRKNVRLIDNQLTLTTDHLDYDLTKNLGKYFGGGQIEDTTNQLSSKLGYYFADENNFFFKDNVHLVNPDYTMDSDTLLYNTNTEISHFFGPSYIRSDTNTIYCENGWYDTRNNISQFNENATLSNSKHSLQGDSLYYDRNLGFGKAFKDVTIIDSVQNVFIKGEFGQFWENTKNSLITDSAQAIQIENGDSLFMHADTLRYIGDTTSKKGKQLFAYYYVKLYRFDLQGKCDSLVYNMKDSVIKMYHNPVLWSANNQLSADFIKTFTANTINPKIILYQNAYMAEMDADSSNFNQIKGKNMYGYFKDDELYKVFVEGNVETIYFVRNEDTKLIGINKTEASDLNIYIKDKHIKELIFIKKPSSVLHPPGSLDKSELLISGFSWYYDQRPRNRYDIFRRE